MAEIYVDIVSVKDGKVAEHMEAQNYKDALKIQSGVLMMGLNSDYEVKIVVN